MSNDWLHGIDKNLKYKILVGTCAMLWEMWLNRNDMAFNKTQVATFMQVFFGRRTY